MAFIEAPTNFYLGRTYDNNRGKLGDEVVYYDSRDLTTHAVVVGMTGSGKTGLCINLLEEAILDNIPAIIIDPKGDITNLALGFPELKPEDFIPWINPDDAARAGMDMPSYAANIAQTWRDGLQGWGIVPDRLTWMKHATKMSIFTPGSDSGLPISILASLRAPRVPWQGNEEMIRERITGVVSAIFALAGKQYDPVKDKEHVLVSNIFLVNWQQGRDLTLEDVILQIKQPPFEKLGVFTVDQYMNEKARYNLAMEMNNIIAAPSFQSWMQGEPLDIQHLLYQPNGRPRVSIFYTAHLNDQERMFITTLLLESMIGWMRTLSGTPSLRALLYIDEIFGYFPPYPKNPPTKEPMMRLLKQARAFGIGLILATQNPGDLDYKGLTNAGTWFIGRLQSNNDVQRVIAGLRSLASADDDLDLNDVQQLVADIKPRVFLMRNVHNSGGPILLHTRWAMSYLAGPLTRQQISLLMAAQRQQFMPAYAQGAAVQPLQQGWNQQGYAQGFNTQGQPFPHAHRNLPGQTNQQFAAPPPPPGFNAPPPPPGFNTQAPPPPGFSAQQTPSFAPPPPPGRPMSGDTGRFNAQNMPAQSDTQNFRMPGNFLQSKPPVTSELREFFLPVTLTSQQAFGQAGQQFNGANVTMAYKPELLAQASVRYQHKASSVYTARQYAFLVPDLDATGLMQWEEHQAPVVDPRQISGEPFGQAIFQEMPNGLTDVKRVRSLESSLTDFLYHTAKIIIPHHKQFKLFGDPDKEDMSEFQAQVYQMAREQRDVEIDKLSQRYAQMMDKLEDQLTRKERELHAEKLEIRDRKREQMYTTGEAILSIFRGRTNYTLSRMSRTTRMKRQTEADLQESREVISELERNMMNLEQEYEEKLKEVNDRWARVATDITELTLTPFKKDISMDIFGVGWVPHYYVSINGQAMVVPAFA